jgi:hypothetical protein
VVERQAIGKYLLRKAPQLPHQSIAPYMKIGDVQHRSVEYGYAARKYNHASLIKHWCKVTQDSRKLRQDDWVDYFQCCDDEDRSFGDDLLRWGWRRGRAVVREGLCWVVLDGAGWCWMVLDGGDDGDDGQWRGSRWNGLARLLEQESQGACVLWRNADLENLDVRLL